MDDDESRKSPGSRPTTAHRVVRKVPGSFDDDEISPAKGTFDESLTSAASQPPDLPPLKSTNIPKLPPPSVGGLDSSFAEGASFDNSKHPLTEQAVRAHLQDIESSFVSSVSPLPTITASGVDDT